MDRDWETLKKLTESSYEDPQDVFIYLLRQTNCNFEKLFTNIGGAQCHERELKTEYREPTSEVCKEHNTVVTIPVQDSSGNWDLDNPPVWDVTGSLTAFDPDETPGPFAVDLLLEDRYNPNPTTTYGTQDVSYNVNPYIYFYTFYIYLPLIYQVPNQSKNTAY